MLIFQFVPILFVISTSSMLILDQRTMQIKYRFFLLLVLNILTISISILITISISIPITISIIIMTIINIRVPAGEIFKLSLSPYFDDIAVFHVRAVSFHPTVFLKCVPQSYFSFTLTTSRQ